MRGEPPVVEDEQLDAGQAGEQTPVTAIAAGKRQRFEQPRQAVIEDGAIVAAGLVTECTGDPALAHPGRSSVILPGVRRLRFGLPTRFIRVAARVSRLSVSRRHAGVEHLIMIIRQPDRSLALLPG